MLDFGFYPHTFAIEIKSAVGAEGRLSENTRKYLALRADGNGRGAVFYLGDLTCTINGTRYVSWRDWGEFGAGE